MLADFSGPADDGAEASLTTLEREVAAPAPARPAKRQAASPAAPAAKRTRTATKGKGKSAVASPGGLALPNDLPVPGRAADSVPTMVEADATYYGSMFTHERDEHVPPPVKPSSSSSAPPIVSLMDPRLDTAKASKSKHSKKDKSRKHNKSRKSRKNRSDDSSRSSGGDRKRRKRRSSSSSESSGVSSVFRGASEDPMGKSWNSLKSRARQYPGRMATELLQRMADAVGRDGVQAQWSSRDMPACAQAFYNRVLASESSTGIPAHQRRDRRESETLCVLLDKLALGRFSLWEPLLLLMVGGLVVRRRCVVVLLWVGW